MRNRAKGRGLFGALLIIAVSYVLILGGISICNRSYSDTHKGIFTEEFAHKIVQE